MFRSEKEFQTAFGKEIKSRWFWINKISDTWKQTKPYDCDVRTNERDYSIELKIWNTIKTDLLKKLLPHQRGNLTFKSNLWASCFIVWYYMTDDIYYLYNVRTKNAFHLSNMQSLVDTLCLQS